MALGGRTKSIAPDSTALLGMLVDLAVASSWAIEVPPTALMARPADGPAERGTIPDRLPTHRSRRRGKPCPAWKLTPERLKAERRAFCVLEQHAFSQDRPYAAGELKRNTAKH